MKRYLVIACAAMAIGAFGQSAECEYSVSANGRAIPVRLTRESKYPFNRVWPGYQRPKDQTENAFCARMFSAGPVKLSVTVKGAFDRAVVRPLSSGVTPSVKGNTVTVELPKPGYYVLETHGASRVLYLLVDSPRDFAEERKTATRVFGPGTHDAGMIDLRDHDRIYVDRDAVVYGCVRGIGVKDVRIFGYGIIDGSKVKRPTGDGYLAETPSCIRLTRCRDVKIDGPVLQDSPEWTLAMFDCEDIAVSRVKIVGQWRYNTDGIDVCNSRRVRVSDCFVRAFDDTLVIKGVPTLRDRSVEDVTFERCVAWCGWGKTIEPGFETWAPVIRNVRFTDCDLIHNSLAAINISAGGATTVDGMVFDDIRVELQADTLPEVYQSKDEMKYDAKGRHGEPMLIKADNRLWTYYYDVIDKKAVRKFSRIRGAEFRNISVFAEPGVPKPVISIEDYAPKGTPRLVEKVLLEGLSINGRRDDGSSFAFVTNAPVVTVLSGKLAIVRDGKSDYAIALPDDKAEAAQTREAADALQLYLRRSTGCTLPIVSESEVGGRPAFYLGRTRKGATAGVPYAKLVDYVNCRKVVGRDVFLAGCDKSMGVKGPLAHHDREYLSQDQGINRQVKDLSYRRMHGTLKAVLGFLERENVVQFILPGENGLNVIPRKTLEIDDSLNFVGANAIQYSNAHCYGGLHTTVALGHLDIPQYKHWGGHTFPVAVPRSKYEKTHPEYFILKDGVRRPDYGPAGGGHHCVSNKDVQRLVVEEMKRQYDLGYRWIQLGPTDGQVPCECDECRKLHPDHHERQWLAEKAIAEQALEAMPDAKIVILAYQFTRLAPKSFYRMPPNVIVELCIWDKFAEHLANWSKFKDVPKLSYVYFFGDYHSWAMAPTRTPRYLAENMRLLKENNVSDIFKCGWGDDIGLEGPTYYVFSRLLEDPYRDPYALVDEFCDRAYFAASEPMKRFFRAMYENMDTPQGLSIIDALKQQPHHPERMFEAAFRPGTFSYMNRLLGHAESIRQTDPKAVARLKLVRRSFDFLWMRSKCYFVQEAWTATHDQSLLTLADKLYDQRDRLLDAWYDDKGKMRPLDGFEWSYRFNLPREMIIRGGGAMCPNFSDLFRFGKNSVKELLKKNKVSLLERESWEGYEEFGRRILHGDGLADLQAAAKENPRCSSDMSGVCRSLLAFRNRHLDFLKDGTIVGELTTLEPAEHVYGVFRRNASGDVALFVCATNPARQTIRFKFPGSDRVETHELGLCTLQMFKQQS